MSPWGVHKLFDGSPRVIHDLFTIKRLAMIYLKTSRFLAQRKTNETKLLGSTPGGRWGARLGLVGGRGEGNGLVAASAGAVWDGVDSADLGIWGSGDLGSAKGFLLETFRARFAVNSGRFSNHQCYERAQSRPTTP